MSGDYSATKEHHDLQACHKRGLIQAAIISYGIHINLFHFAKQLYVFYFIPSKETL